MDSNIGSSFEAERQIVRTTVTAIDRQLGILEAIPRYHGDDLVEQSVDDIRQQQKQRLRKALPSPYFGRLDFAADTGRGQGDPVVEPLYIGKVGIQDDANGDILVVDWRAPISSLFYSFTGDSQAASYRSPDGLVSGTIHLKRNFAIEHGELHRMVDSYVRGVANAGLADEFLLYRLSEHKDAKLRDIVSTIQAEQDRIIRGPRDAAMFIQGVAGSGKTTVALHRLAYLLYEYQDRVRAERMMVFAPNRMFLNYIADVLPELGVGDIAQTTFADWAVSVLQVPVEVAAQANRYGRWFDPTGEATAEDALVVFKGSLACQSRLKTCVAETVETWLPADDFTPWPGLVVSAESIHEWFYDEYRHLPPNPRRERILARLRRWVDANYRDIQEDDSRGALRKAALAKLRAFAKAWKPLDTMELYRRTLQTHVHNEQVKFKKVGRNWQVQTEDLAPLLLLQDLMDGTQGHPQFDHVVFDEAQDFSPLQLAVIAGRTPSGSFTILGDLSQSIFPALGVSSWDELRQVFTEHATEYFELNRSYRSTMEIVQFANQVLERHRVVTPAEPVFRSGDNVMQHHVEASELEAAIRRAALEARHSGSESVAIVTRTEAEALAIWRAMEKGGMRASYISADNETYEGGVSVLPVYLSKGLEFDAVILADVNAVNYPDDALSAKLLYVGCTRALHRLHILTTGVPSPLLPTTS